MCVCVPLKVYKPKSNNSERKRIRERKKTGTKRCKRIYRMLLCQGRNGTTTFDMVLPEREDFNADTLVAPLCVFYGLCWRSHVYWIPLLWVYVFEFSYIFAKKKKILNRHPYLAVRRRMFRILRRWLRIGRLKFFEWYS